MRTATPSVLCPLQRWVGAAALLSWTLTHIAYRARGVSFDDRLEGAVATWAPLVLPLLIAPVTTLPRIRLQNRLAEANARLVTEVERSLQLQAELQHQSHHDPLTGVLDRRGFFEAAARFHGSAAFLLLCYLDSFTRVNDEHGHAAGDAVLQSVADALSVRCAAADGLVGRLGGDEFAALLPVAAEDDARAVREDLADLRVVLPDGTVLQVRASVGTTRLSAEQSVEAGTAAADAGMCALKRPSGR